MTATDKYDVIKKDFPDILKKSLGIVTTACLNAGIHRDTYYRWRNNDAEFALKCDEADEHTCDWVENKLHKLIDGGDTAATIFYCKTKMRKRGFVEKRELEHSGDKDNPIRMQTVYSKDQVDEMLDAISEK